MNLLALAFPILAAAAAPQQFQDSGDVAELQFHRVHLLNGNFIDGKLIKDSPNYIVLLVRAGEMTFKKSMIDRLEFVKMKDRWQPPIIVDKNPKGTPPPTGTTPTEKTPEVNTPEAIRKKVDMILFAYKQTRKSSEDQLPVDRIKALGEEAVVYLAAQSPIFDLQSQEAIAQALIQLKPTPKVVEVLEKLLNHENPRTRALALTVLCVDASEADKARYAGPRLRDSDPRVRITALSGLGSTTERDLFEPMMDLCGDLDKDVRGRAMRIAKNLAEKHELKENLARAMAGNTKHSDEGVRSDAASMLGALGRLEFWRDLTAALSDPSVNVRSAAAQSLGQLAVPDSIEAVVIALGRERDRWPRLHLAAAAMRLKAVPAVEPLIAWLSDSDEEMRKTAVGTLQGITGEIYGLDREKWAQWWERNRPK